MKWISIVLLIAFATTSCNEEQTTGNEDTTLKDTVLTIDLSQQYQVMEGFGASDAWSTQYVGNWGNEKVKNEIADLLFSQQLGENGDPEGIGLNIWRFNIGAGSKAQGTASNIHDPWRRTEGFLQNDGTYDWTKQSGQRWFLQAAKQRGVEKFIGFSNSAPVQMTKNGKANTSSARQTNLSPDKFEDFAEFLTEVAKNLEANDGIKLNDISPVNETQWDWDQSSGQEGCPFTNTEMAQLVRILDQKITDKGLSTKIELTEAGQLDYLYKSNTNRPGKDNQIQEFYGNGNNAVGELKNMSDYVAGHSYWTTEPSKLAPMRKALWNKIQEVDPTLKYNMSEYCIMGDNEEGIVGNGKDLSIDMGLYLAKVLHYDLTEANASSWQWWIAISPYNYKDGLIYIDKSEVDGGYQTSKMLYALGNYSRFIKKGMTRVHTNQLFGRANDDPFTQKRIMASAYANNDEIVLVLVNYNNYEYTIQLDFDGQLTGNQMKMYRTSKAENLKYIGNQEVGEEVVVAPQSVTTYVISR
ncbi:glycoside hydrolase [Flammeovirga sp. EKP202]|uniref:glycoside hydrolase n=1 Tax=Flammeovirga sp. EKP202 TaxID=2770592 RepID=UPI00165FE493|nr:glycoside hydrolase [Flammeovirga sp. EKP202]MBD0404677.1 xylanase [Flammeovirga sp. EKP202]